MLVILTLAANGEHDSSKNLLSVIPASEILAKIQKGEPVEYDHVIVGGNLDLSKLDLPKKLVNRTFKGETQKVIASPIRINDSAFNGVVWFDNAIFNEKIDLHGSNFYENVDFHCSNFAKDVKFGGATFRKYADFNEARFQGIADFTNATFSETKVPGLTGIADDLFAVHLNREEELPSVEPGSVRGSYSDLPISVGMSTSVEPRSVGMSIPGEPRPVSISIPVEPRSLSMSIY